MTPQKGAERLFLEEVLRVPEDAYKDFFHSRVKHAPDSNPEVAQLAKAAKALFDQVANTILTMNLYPTVPDM